MQINQEDERDVGEKRSRVISDVILFYLFIHLCLKIFYLFIYLRARGGIEREREHVPVSWVGVGVERREKQIPQDLSLIHI